MDNTAKISEMLYEKVENEYNAFIERLKQMPPDKIIDHAYEKIFKEDLMVTLEEKKLSYNEAKAMLSLKYPLDELYQEWMRTDISYMDMLSDIVDNRVRKAVIQQQKREKER